jgi:hypothetical protein
MAGIRLQARHWRSLTWVATLGVAGGAGTTLWKIVDNFRSGKYRSRSSSDFNTLIEQAPGTIKKDQIGVTPINDYTRLWTSHYNGFVPKPPEEVKEKTVEPVVPTKKPIGDVLSVKAVTYAPEDQGRVVIEYKEDSAMALAHTEQLILKVSAKLVQPYDTGVFNGSLKTIKADSAVFNWCGEEIELHPTRRDELPRDPKPAGKKTKSVGSDPEDDKALALHKDAKETINLGGERYLVGSDDRDNMNKNGDKFLEDMTIKTRTGADKKAEVVLGGIRPKSPLATNYGLQNDDVVVSINGNAVQSKNQAIQWARENPNLPRYDVVIRRKGKEFTKTFLVPQK